MADKKYGRNKKWCEHYKSSGRREKNKALKQARAERLIARFAKRREDGKAYEYKPNPYDKDSKNRKEKKKYWNEYRRRAEKNVDHKNPVSRWKSIMRKVQNEVDAEEERKKRELEEKRKTFVHKPHKKKTIAEEAVE